MIPIAKEGMREIVLATIILGAGVAGGVWLFWPAAIPFVIVWFWVLSFFRDPRREGSYAPGNLCAPADGRVTEVTELEEHELIGGPALRIGIFMSIFNVHASRASCAGRVRAISYQPGEFLDARHPESGRRNESNTLLIDPDAPMPGPLEIRQVAGTLARRIVCHARLAEHLPMGSRFGMIKFGSRTELIIPQGEGTEVRVRVGDRVRAGLTIIAHQPVEAGAGDDVAAPRPTEAQPAPLG